MFSNYFSEKGYLIRNMNVSGSLLKQLEEQIQNFEN